AVVAMAKQKSHLVLKKIIGFNLLKVLNHPLSL
ncbi:MAG: hypothetical protein ACJART_001685, partial [Maribacter sp.]